MQLTATRTTPVAATDSVMPGTVIANAVDDGMPVQIVAGRILRADVRDIRDAGGELMEATFRSPLNSYMGMVAFVRNGAGDAWTAVELLTKGAEGASRLMSPWHVGEARFADDVQVDAMWNIGHYGGDYTSYVKSWRAPRA